MRRRYIIESNKGIDLRRHIVREQDQHPEALGEFTQLLGQITLAAKIVSKAVKKTGIVDVLGTAGAQNVHGEEQAQLDVYANRIFKNALIENGGVRLIGSEEDQEITIVNDPPRTGRYGVAIDPLDGSSNIPYNVSIGTIFAIFRTESDVGPDGLLRPGRELEAAGYIIYGSSTMLVYTTGEQVYGFTLDPSIGEFILTHPNITVPDDPSVYSVNESYYDRWTAGVKKSVREFKNQDELTARYIGSLVADFHRNLFAGGVFLYPPEPDTPGKEQGKLRLLYEAAPLAYVVRAAGGYASDGTTSILDRTPETVHQRTPLYIGNRQLVQGVETNIDSEA